jgi:hypothetical protein
LNFALQRQRQRTGRQHRVVEQFHRQIVAQRLSQVDQLVVHAQIQLRHRQLTFQMNAVFFQMAQIDF